MCHLPSFHTSTEHPSGDDSELPRYHFLAMDPQHETIDVLAQKVEDLAKVNAGILQEVEAKYQANATVVSGFRHVVNVDFSKRDTVNIGYFDADSNESAPTPGLSFESVPVESPLCPLIDAWSAENVAALEEPKDFFHDNIDYSLRNYADVKRLQEQVPGVAEKWTFARDTPASRMQVRIFLSNLEKLQVAIGQLHKLSLDEHDPLSGTESGDDVKRGLELVEQGWGLIEKHMKSASLEGRAAAGELPEVAASLLEPDSALVRCARCNSCDCTGCTVDDMGFGLFD